MPNEKVYEGIRAHLSDFWPDRAHEEFVWTLGPIGRKFPRFRVRRIAPAKVTDPWVYATVGAWEATAGDHQYTEFFLLSPSEDPRHVELLAMVASMHADGRYRLDVGSTVSIGRAWMDDSRATYLLVSLPYPYGPTLEWCEIGEHRVRYLWLVPVTEPEAVLVRQRGIGALEDLLELSGANVVAPNRPSVI